jgi:hypothetical protein
MRCRELSLIADGLAAALAGSVVRPDYDRFPCKASRCTGLLQALRSSASDHYRKRCTRELRRCANIVVDVETGAALVAATDPFIARGISRRTIDCEVVTHLLAAPVGRCRRASHHEVWGRNAHGRSGFHFVSSIVLLDAFTAAVRASFSDPRWKFHDDHLLLRSTPKARDGKHALAPLALDDRAHPPVLG